jgi:hypothetical protein
MRRLHEGEGRVEEEEREAGPATTFIMAAQAAARRSTSDGGAAAASGLEIRPSHPEGGETRGLKGGSSTILIRSIQ